MANPLKKTYFGLVALIIGIISLIFLGANIGVAYLRITPAAFDQLNNLTLLFYCILTPAAFACGVAGSVLKGDSKTYSRIAIVVVLVPFLVIISLFIKSMIDHGISIR
jgi:hypothetical protein